MEYTAVIPARAGSKGIPNKNIVHVNGLPLVVWSIKQALSSQYINRVIVSTDSEQIASIALDAGAEVPGLRPANIAGDTASTETALLHAYRSWISGDGDDAIVLLQPTSPLRLSGTIDKAIKHFVSSEADSLFTACENHAFFWKNMNNPEALYDYQNRPRRQDIVGDDRWFRENGSIYITKASILEECNNRLGGKVAMFLMGEDESLEIDSLVELEILDKLMGYRGL